MKNLIACFWIAMSVSAPLRAATWTGPIYLSGHADIGVEYLEGPPRFELQVRFDGDSQFSEGHDLSLQDVAANQVAILTPNPPLYRQAYTGDPLDPDDDYDVTGPEWDFLAADQDEPFWFLPQASDPQKPFFGFATYRLDPPEWSSSVAWSLLEVVSAPAGGEVSLWQTNFFGQPDLKYASFDGLDPTEDSFVQGVGGHDHYNWGFSTPGVYEVRLAAESQRIGVGLVQGSDVFTFLVGDYISASSPGDFNGDGIVNLADYTVWRDGLGAMESAGTLSNNGTGGTVNNDDYQLWKEHFGTVYSSPHISAAQPTPEPASLILCLLAFTVTAAIRCRSSYLETKASRGRCL